jgi:mono/diheme cytochrome c family protein
LYNIYCAVCHGEKGRNDGTVSSRQATLKPAWSGYQDSAIRNLPVGKIYHVITYGKNNMGSYASALSPKERWEVISYVKRLSAMGDDDVVPPASVPVEATEYTAVQVKDSTVHDTSAGQHTPNHN